MAPTPAFLPGKSPGQKNLAGCRVRHDRAAKQRASRKLSARVGVRGGERWVRDGAELRARLAGGPALLPTIPRVAQGESTSQLSRRLWASGRYEPSHCGCPSFSSYVDHVFGIHVHNA